MGPAGDGDASARPGRRVAVVTGGAGAIGGAIVLAQAFVPGMAARGFGRIIFVVSDTVWSPPAASMLAYVTSKGALIALARTLAAGHGADGIAVTCVAPGLTETPAARRGVPATVRFLASDGAAALTGQTLCADGGLIMR
jgi:NAD(P)-dependent dehydrogenase (short-subunit alcohol dehydrogenase family)